MTGPRLLVFTILLLTQSSLLSAKEKYSYLSIPGWSKLYHKRLVQEMEANSQLPIVEIKTRKLHLINFARYVVNPRKDVKFYRLDLSFKGVEESFECGMISYDEEELLIILGCQTNPLFGVPRVLDQIWFLSFEQLGMVPVLP